MKTVVEQSDEKICPSCSETVKSQAKVCRFCRHDFSSTGDDTARKVASGGLALVAVALLVVGVVAFLLITRDGSDYGSAREIVADLEKAGIGCGSREYIEDISEDMSAVKGLTLHEKMFCNHDQATGYFTVYFVISGEVNDLVNHFQQGLDHLQQVHDERNQEIAAAGGQPTGPPLDDATWVVGPNWLVSADGDPLTEDIHEILGGRIVSSLNE